MKDSKISWTHHTFSPWIGCTKVSAGCANCYAEAQQDILYKKVRWGKGQPRKRTSENYWKEPLKWDKLAQLGKTRFRVFPSLCDPFDPEVSDDWRHDFFDLILRTKNLVWLLLTKHPEYAETYLKMVHGWPWPNVALGTSTENQETVDLRVPIISRIPAPVHFISAEPLLECIDVRLYLTRTIQGPNIKSFAGPVGSVYSGPLDWVICGGESGQDFRNMRPAWALNLFTQCQEYKVPFFMKQGSAIHSGAKADIPDGLWDVKEFPKGIL